MMLLVMFLYCFYCVALFILSESGTPPFGRSCHLYLISNAYHYYNFYTIDGAIITQLHVLKNCNVCLLYVISCGTMGTVTCAIILKLIRSISDISLVFINYSLGIVLHICLFKFDKRANSKQSAQKDAHCNLPVHPSGTTALYNDFYN